MPAMHFSLGTAVQGRSGVAMADAGLILASIVDAKLHGQGLYSGVSLHFEIVTLINTTMAMAMAMAMTMTVPQC